MVKQFRWEKNPKNQLLLKHFSGKRLWRSLETPISQQKKILVLRLLQRYKCSTHDKNYITKHIFSAQNPSVLVKSIMTSVRARENSGAPFLVGICPVAYSQQNVPRKVTASYIAHEYVTNVHSDCHLSSCEQVRRALATIFLALCSLQPSLQLYPQGS